MGHTSTLDLIVQTPAEYTGDSLQTNLSSLHCLWRSSDHEGFCIIKIRRSESIHNCKTIVLIDWNHRRRCFKIDIKSQLVGFADTPSHQLAGRAPASMSRESCHYFEIYSTHQLLSRSKEPKGKVQQCGLSPIISLLFLGNAPKNSIDSSTFVSSGHEEGISWIVKATYCPSTFLGIHHLA